MIWLSQTLITSPVKYALCLSESEFKSYLDEICPGRSSPYLSTPYALATAQCFDNSTTGQRYVVVCLNPNLAERPLCEVIGLLVHEATHIWQEIRDHIGESKPSVEFEAYSMQQISQNLVEEYLNRCVTKIVKRTKPLAPPRPKPKSTPAARRRTKASPRKAP